MSKNKKVVIEILIAVLIIAISVLIAYKLIEKNIIDREDFKYTVNDISSGPVDTINNEIIEKNETDTNLVDISSKESENTEIYNKDNHESTENNSNNDLKTQNKSTNVISVGMTKQEIVSICGEPKQSNISHEGNLNAKNKGVFGTYDEFWYYSKNSQKFGIYFLHGKVVGISATNSKTKLSGPVNSLTIN